MFRRDVLEDADVLKSLACIGELFWHACKRALVNNKTAAVCDALLRHYERVVEEIGRVTLVAEGDWAR